MVTMAPELDGAEETARVLADSGVTVSLGHSGADYETAARALSGSWSAVTHLFNQMSPFHHRSPGVVLAALLSDAPCGLIADGLHNHPDTIRMAWTQLGPERTVLVTDAVAAMGMPQGSYRLGESPVTLGPDGPRTEQGTLAGSELTMAGAVANLASWTSSTIEEALVSASSTPARLAGKEDRGRLQPGARADFVFLDRQMRVVETVVGGETLYKAKERG